MTQSQQILLVTDRAHLRLARAFEERGLAVSFAQDCDFGSVVNGIEFIRRVRATPQLAAILILIASEWGTGEPTLALAAGADAYEPNKGSVLEPEGLIGSIERLLSRQVAAAN